MREDITGRLANQNFSFQSCPRVIMRIKLALCSQRSEKRSEEGKERRKEKSRPEHSGWPVGWSLRPRKAHQFYTEFSWWILTTPRQCRSNSGRVGRGPIVWPWPPRERQTRAPRDAVHGGFLLQTQDSIPQCGAAMTCHSDHLQPQLNKNKDQNIIAKKTVLL